ncbi:hypothetical protein Pmani_026121 [Petrolisthes manimaculis]|uniref:Uncharacterized protein n=1 Tax=Petrolisthes manimaculis TaxID=1843537 RepID=A0AAE1P6H3_9EUCA|nr:hypothetical protein Pmani_026121 [Petrolisthes manimaculis]
MYDALCQTCLVLVVAVVGVALAAPNPQEHYGPPQPSYQPEPTYKAAPHKEEPPKPYAFDYGVQDSYSGANFGHAENSDGKAITGSYQVALPDGRIQKVTYVADHYNGFQANVEYEGEAKYPENTPYKGSQPSYQPPQPSYRPQPSYSPPSYSAKEAEVETQQDVYSIDDPAPQEYL